MSEAAGRQPARAFLPRGNGLELCFASGAGNETAENRHFHSPGRRTRGYAERACCRHPMDAGRGRRNARQIRCARRPRARRGGCSVAKCGSWPWEAFQAMSKSKGRRELPYEARARIADNLFLLRRRAGHSQGELAELARVSAGQIGSIESGKALGMLDTYVRLAGALSLTLDDLLAGVTWTLESSSSKSTLATKSSSRWKALRASGRSAGTRARFTSNRRPPGCDPRRRVEALPAKNADFQVFSVLSVGSPTSDSRAKWICGDVIGVGNFWREIPEIVEPGSNGRRLVALRSSAPCW